MKNTPITYGYVEGYEECIKETEAVLQKAIATNMPTKERLVDALNMVIANLYQQKLKASSLLKALEAQMHETPDFDVCEMCMEEEELAEQDRQLRLTLIIGGKFEGGM